MAHEFESGFYTVTPAWHGLGVVLDEAPSIDEAIIKAGLDWTVEERPLFIDTDEAWPSMYKGALTEVDTHKALIRSTDKRILSVVGANYSPVQNADAFRWFDFLIDSGEAKLEAGGSLRHGQKIWILAKLGESMDIIKGDEVAPYILLSNSHDSTAAITISFTPTRVVCMNTLSAALRNIDSSISEGSAIRFKHTQNVGINLERAKDLINMSTQVFESSKVVYKEFTTHRMNDEQFKTYFHKIYFGNKKYQEMENNEKGSGEKVKKFNELQQLFESGIGTDIKGVRGSVWGGYNAITEWVDHHRGNAEKRLDTSWFGIGADIRSRAFEEAVKFIKVGA